MRISDWSSDWCSSDLRRRLCIELQDKIAIKLRLQRQIVDFIGIGLRIVKRQIIMRGECLPVGRNMVLAHAEEASEFVTPVENAAMEATIGSGWAKLPELQRLNENLQIGRASCRERVCQYV